MAGLSDLTIVYYTAGVIPELFADTVRTKLLENIDGLPVISVSKKPLLFGQNIVVDTPRSHVNIYKDALTGVRAAKTKYIALCEDDVLYSPAHFMHRPSSGKFLYNLSVWSLFTWGEPLFTHKGTVRKNLNALICERDLFIEAMDERFKKFEGKFIDNKVWAEPGKYERQLGVTIRETEEFYSNPSNIVFSHQTALGFDGLGVKKRLGEFRANTIPYWGTAEDMVGLYK